MLNRYRNIRPLVVGTGVVGKRHLEAQLNLGIKTGIYNIHPESNNLFKKNKNILIFNKLENAIDWSNLVHVCTPDNKHTKFVVLALKKRKAVLCEKSFTTNLEDALYLQRLAHKYKSVLIVGQNYRLTPTFQETKQRIVKGALGKITGIETTYLHDMTEYQKRSPLNKNQDFLYIGGSHAVDLMCWIVDDKVVSIQAESKKTKRNFPASYQIKLGFTSGLVGNIKLDASSSRLKNGTDLIVEGTKGKIISHNKIDKLTFYRNGNEKPQIVRFPNNTTHTIAMEVKIVDDYLIGKIKSYSPLPGVDEAVNIIKILDKVAKAVSSGKNESI